MMQKIRTKTLSLFIILFFTLTACGGPGMKAPSKGLQGKNKVYFDSLDQEVEIVPISDNKKREMEVYQLEEGDIVNITPTIAEILGFKNEMMSAGLTASNNSLFDLI